MFVVIRHFLIFVETNTLHCKQRKIEVDGSVATPKVLRIDTVRRKGHWGGHPVDRYHWVGLLWNDFCPSSSGHQQMISFLSLGVS